jgi:putative glycerol-1-phosphate prenyltransferase
MISQVNILDELHQKLMLQQKSFSVLIDPDKVEVKKVSSILSRLPKDTDYIFVGGSCVENHKTDEVVKAIKAISELPVILFPGNINQISPHADAILFLSLMSGDNPEYLIHQQVKSVQYLRQTNLEIIPTAYILIDGGKTCTTERVTGTKAIPQTEVQSIVDIALAAQYAGKKLIYLEAGSGARFPIKSEIIKDVRKEIDVPLIVGGGIRTKKQRQIAYDAGADMVVMGTVFET